MGCACVSKLTDARQASSGGGREEWREGDSGGHSGRYSGMEEAQEGVLRGPHAVSRYYSDDEPRLASMVYVIMPTTHLQRRYTGALWERPPVTRGRHFVVLGFIVFCPRETVYIVISKTVNTTDSSGVFLTQ